MAEVDACAPQGVIRDRVAALGEGGLRLAGGALATFPALRLEGAATAWLADQSLGRAVEIRGAGAPDRWGRLPAGAVTVAGPDGAPPSWLEAQLVAQGLAVVAPRPGARCVRPLLAREQAARRAGKGRWAEAANQPVAARDLARLNALAGRYALVEGRISAVNTRGRTVYVNFGRRWREDFTVMVAARDRRAFAQAGLELAGMVGETIRVRGHIEARGGPAIEAQTPDQIERLEAAK
ncbi:thermonuclease family protein [Blastochloris sulfoviridis]|uniref:Thermonuclease family protein n=1 Tax=Blastochloris sulfoviridis TaxID=50712 RepID=A0A5M6I685_9HYPH|nr:thermonuclease family protein [Blastochloris sulfoviridis]KAA5603298.1 thermonuclease family protein [Blastochloris sulfoviridis]